MPYKPLIPFSKWLKEELKEVKMPQMELAIETNMCQSQISHYITGKITPNLETVEKILAVFGKKLVVVDNDA